jgi:hypothetical protein
MLHIWIARKYSYRRRCIVLATGSVLKKKRFTLAHLPTHLPTHPPPPHTHTHTTKGTGIHARPETCSNQRFQRSKSEDTTAVIGRRYFVVIILAHTICRLLPLAFIRCVQKCTLNKFPWQLIAKRVYSTGNKVVFRKCIRRLVWWNWI